MKKTVFVAGHRGLVGQGLTRFLSKNPEYQVLKKNRQELDLFDREAVFQFFGKEKPQYVLLAAAKVGGILANNNYPVDFLVENLKIQNNIIEAAYESGVQKLVFLGSSCIYPKHCPQPIKEEYLLTGALEPTNEPYALAKITGIKLCQAYRRQYGANFISVMPTNLYGPGDNFHLENSHVIPAMLRKFHEAKIEGKNHVTLWGTGKARREFLHVDDLASAVIWLMERYNEAEHINIGCGSDVMIAELAEMVRQVVGYQGKIVWDTSKPDGTPVKRLDVFRLQSMGWQPKIGLQEGLASTYAWFIENQSVAKKEEKASYCVVS